MKNKVFGHIMGPQTTEYFISFVLIKIFSKSCFKCSFNYPKLHLSETVQVYLQSVNLLHKDSVKLIF